MTFQVQSFERQVRQLKLETPKLENVSEANR
jgi:hypothetical protein